ncbi:MAG TPA: hypothetical protein VFN10_22600 [Thermoanaerobaculia bacterium]|nr:hypothetical protein [Thermoanaerobaculia bacterium]
MNRSSTREALRTALNDAAALIHVLQNRTDAALTELETRTDVAWTEVAEAQHSAVLLLELVARSQYEANTPEAITRDRVLAQARIEFQRRADS